MILSFRNEGPFARCDFELSETNQPTRINDVAIRNLQPNSHDASAALPSSSVQSEYILILEGHTERAELFYIRRSVHSTPLMSAYIHNCGDVTVVAVTAVTSADPSRTAAFCMNTSSFVFTREDRWYPRTRTDGVIVSLQSALFRHYSTLLPSTGF